MNKIDFKNNIIILGDNLKILQEIPAESVDLIYLDPPFNSNKQYIIVDEGKTGAEEVKYFNDVWKGGSNTYLEFLFDRLLLMKRALKKTGSLYLHCDPTESHYIKVMMDKVFGRNQFRNEIIWAYRTGGASKKFFSQKHDNLFWYTKTDDWKFNQQKEKSYLTHKYGFTNVEIKQDGDGYYTEVGMRDVWQLDALRGNQPENVKFPTQKPLALLERIIKASSNEGDVVLDPFMGSGTTLVAANNLKRKFIGIDRSASSITTTQHRLDQVGAKYTVHRTKLRYEDIRNMEPFTFEKQVVEHLGGISNDVQRGDKGIDGRILSDPKKVISIKRSDKIGRNVVDNFASAMRREGVTEGIIVAFTFSKGAWTEVSRLKTEDNLNIELKEVRTFLDMTEPPEVKLTLEKNNIKANATDTDGEIVNYAWYLDGEAIKLTDKKGLFSTESLNGSQHKITCKVTDNDATSTTVDYKYENGVLELIE